MYINFIYGLLNIKTAPYFALFPIKLFFYILSSATSIKYKTAPLDAKLNTK